MSAMEASILPDLKRPRNFYETVSPSAPSAGPALSRPLHYAQSSQHTNTAPYPSPSRTSPPSSFHGAPLHDRNLPDPQSSYAGVPRDNGTHEAPRDARFTSDNDSHRRRNSLIPTDPRSPTDTSQFPPAPRHMSITSPTDGQHYPPPYTLNQPGHASFHAQPDHQVNGHHPQHPAAIHAPEAAQSHMPPGYGAEFAPAQTHPGLNPYNGLPYGVPPQAGIAPGVPPVGLRHKKSNRAQQACDVCRARKAKCDEGRPSCGLCLENGVQCNYQSIAPAKADRNNQNVVEQMEKLQSYIESTLLRELAEIKGLLADHGLSTKSFSSINTKAEKDIKPKMRSPTKLCQSNPNTQSFEGRPVGESPGGSFNTNSTEASTQDTLTQSVPKPNAIHTEHEVAAQKLFRWPSIKALLQQCADIDFDENLESYVMQMEMRKGPLRLYGRGLGPEATSWTHFATSPPSSSIALSNVESPDPMGSGTAADSAWGHGVNPFVGDAGQSSTVGGLNADNSLKLDSGTITELHQSFMANIQILHPILEESWLVKVMDAFKRKYGGPRDANVPPASTVSRDDGEDLNIIPGQYVNPLKRKYSDSQSSNDNAMSPSMSRTSRPMLERSPVTALILLVLALGKICKTRHSLPGILPPARDHLNNTRAQTPATITATTTTIHHTDSPTSITYPPSYPFPPHPRSSHHSPRSSEAGLCPASARRNIDIVPGLAYYAQATDMLGNLTGSHDILYVQCCILAGLYAGQLVNTIESLAWIQNAARACCILAKDPTLGGIAPPMQNAIRLAYHTSLQLESDILAEMDLPPSGIRNITGVDYPRDRFYEDPASTEPDRRPTIMKYYAFQLHLRNLLDATQKRVYPPGKNLSDIAQDKDLHSILTDWLKGWRQNLPAEFQWNDGDAPARGDINQARLRGKYYGALYIIHRPMLHLALQLEREGKLEESLGLATSNTMTTTTTTLTMGGGSGGSTMGPPSRGTSGTSSFCDEVVNAARTTIQAAIWSTEAFDGIMEYRRLVVTNIFGTAHAQFGNMLVLSAAYTSRYFRRFISENPRATMEHLFRRTITFLKDLAGLSYTLRHDLKILRSLERVVLEHAEDVLMT